MLTYNTQKKHLILPEYGRSIQTMVDHCLTLPTKEERTRCAYTIVETMAKLFPDLKSNGQINTSVWDHLAIMSDYKLDIDYPVEIVLPDNSNPDKVDYNDVPFSAKHYGRNIQLLIEKIISMDDGEEKDYFVEMLANHMKKVLISSTGDSVEDVKVFKDIFEMSKGAIYIAEDALTLHDYNIPVQPAGKKKKKKN